MKQYQDDQWNLIKKVLPKSDLEQLKQFVKKHNLNPHEGSSKLHGVVFIHYYVPLYTLDDEQSLELENLLKSLNNDSGYVYGNDGFWFIKEVNSSLLDENNNIIWG